MSLKRNTSAFATVPAAAGTGAAVNPDGSGLTTVKAKNIDEHISSVTGAAAQEAKSVLNLSAALIIGSLVVLWLLGGIALRNVNL